MIAYEVEARGLEEQIKLLNAYDAIATQELYRAMDRSVNVIRDAAKDLTPIGATGALHGSIAYSLSTQGLGSVVGRVGSNLRKEIYPEVMEFGRGPGPISEKGMELLAVWVHRKLRVPDKKLKSVTYLVARKIRKFGFKGRFFMKHGWEQARPRVEQFFAHALERIAKALEVHGGA